MSQLILQTFCRFTYVTARSTTVPLLHLRHMHFTYVTWRAGYAPMIMFNISMQFYNLQWLWPAGLYERCKLALDLKRLKTPGLHHRGIIQFFISWFLLYILKSGFIVRKRITAGLITISINTQIMFYHITNFRG